MDIPISGSARKLFGAAFVITVALLLFLQFIIIPWIADEPTPSGVEVSDQVIGHIIGTLVGGTLLAIVALKLLPKSERPEIVHTLAPHQIHETLEQDIRASTSWRFRGALGEYTRARTIPEIVERTARSQVRHRLDIELLDPTDDRAVESYALFRASEATGNDEDWSADRVRRDIYATILTAACAASEQPLLTVTLGLQPAFSILLLDVGDQHAIITKTNRTQPALVFPRESFYYAACTDEFDWSLRQSRNVGLRSAAIDRAGLTAQNVGGALTRLGLGSPYLESAGNCTELMQAFAAPVNPYD